MARARGRGKRDVKSPRVFWDEGLYLELEVGILPSRHLVLVHIGAGAAQVRLKGRVQTPRLLPEGVQPAAPS